MAILNTNEEETKKRLAEATRLLVEDERRFHEIFDRSAVGESIVNLDGKWLDVNERMCNIVGYSRKELLKKHFADITYPADIKASEEARERLLAGKNDYIELEKRYIHKNGNIVWVLLSIALYRNHDKNPHYFIAHTQDVTQFKNIEKQLKESQEKFFTIFHSSPSLISVTRLSDSKIMDINEGFTNLLGYSGSEAIGNTIKNLKIWVNQKDRDDYANRMKNIGEVYSFETDLRKKDGAIISAIVYARTLKINGETCIISIVNNITERKKYEKEIKESEEKYHAIVENGNDGIVIVRDFLTKFANSKLLEMAGYSMEEVLGKPFLNFIDSEFADLVKENYKKRVGGDKVEESYEIKIIKKDGTKIPVEISGSHINYDGVPSDMVFVRDITARKQREEELKQYKFIIEQSHQEIGIADLTGTILYVNMAMAKNRGYTQDELVGKKISIFHSKEEMKKVNEDLRILMEKGHHRYEVMQLRKDGSNYWTLMDNFILKVDSKPKYIIGMAVDITELKNAEKEAEEQKSLLDSIVKSTNDGLLVIDKNGKVTFYNDNFKKLWEIPESIIKTKDDKKLLDFVMGQLADPKEFLDRVNYLYSHPEEEGYETIKFKDGRVFDRISIPQKMGDDIVGRIWGFSDITQKTETLKKEKDRVEEIERMNKLAIGRELKIVELKKEIENLKKKAG